MIITISGKAGSGKSTIAKLVAEKLKLKHYSIGDLMREMAKKRGLTLLELSKIAEKDNSIDKELDEAQVKLGKEKDNFVIDGRLTAFFIPNTNFKIFLDADARVRAERILNDKRDGETCKDINEMIKTIERREKSEKLRYMKYYNVDYYNKDLYDFIIDTTSLSVEETVNKVLDFVKK